MRKQKKIEIEVIGEPICNSTPELSNMIANEMIKQAALAKGFIYDPIANDFTPITQQVSA